MSQSTSSEEDHETDSNEGKLAEDMCQAEKENSFCSDLQDSHSPNPKKEHKTAWRKMKEMIHPMKGGVVKKRTGNDDIIEFKNEEDLVQEMRCEASGAPRLMLTHPSTEELSRPRRPSPLKPTWQESEEEGECAQTKGSKWSRVKSVLLSSPTRSSSNPSSPLRQAAFHYHIEEEAGRYEYLVEGKERSEGNVHEEVRRSFRQLQRRLSNEFQRRFSEWESKGKGASSFSSGGSSACEEEVRRREEWRAVEWRGPREKKELAWIDKELAKAAKERLRLDKERDKTILRQDRLNKMKLAVEGRREEVVIPTSTGTFRFEGISESFTRRLYEWEKARGIGPEASTLTLLDPKYRPPQPNSQVLVRSKSIGSMADLAAPAVARHPSSLSLNNVQDIHLPSGHGESGDDSEKDDVCPSDLAPHLHYDSEEHFVDSTSDCDKELAKVVSQRGSYQYCPESRCLIEKLKKEREMCRELEQNIESLEGRISELSKSLERIDNGSSGRDLSKAIGEQNTASSQVCCGWSVSGVSPLPCRDTPTPLWLSDSADSFSIINHLLDHLLHIVNRLERCIEREPGGRVTPFSSRRSVPCENLHQLDEWLSNQDDFVEELELPAFPALLNDKILEIRRVLGYCCKKVVSDSEEVFRSKESGAVSPAYSGEEKETSEGHDTENDCSSRASSFTYHPCERFDDGWDWRHSRARLECLQEDCSSSGSEQWTPLQVKPNLVVPTVRKIFSPVRLEDSGQTSFIELVLEEDELSEEKRNEELIGEKRDEQDEKPDSPAEQHLLNGINVSERTLAMEEPRKEACLERKEIQLEKDESEIVLEKMEEVKSAYIDIGFPPISPIRTRKELKTKDVSPLKRIIAARNSKRLYEMDLEGRCQNSGSSSPETSSVVDRCDRRVLDGFKSASTTQLKGTEEGVVTRGVLKSSSTGAIGTQERDEGRTITEKISALEEKEQCSPLSTPDSLRLRALKIQRAKEEFLRGEAPETTIEVKEGEPGGELLMVKSSSEGAMEGRREARVTRWAERRSLAVERLQQEAEPTRSCPSSPVLPRHEPAWWTRLPAKIFRPKGKYTITNK